MAALELGRRFLLVDNNPEALAVMARRFEDVEDIQWFGYEPSHEGSRKKQQDLFPPSHEARRRRR